MNKSFKLGFELQPHLVWHHFELEISPQDLVDCCISEWGECDEVPSLEEAEDIIKRLLAGSFDINKDDELFWVGDILRELTPHWLLGDYDIKFNWGDIRIDVQGNKSPEFA